jgi:hypothetical protein
MNEKAFNGRYIAYILSVVVPDLSMNRKIDLNNLESRVFGFVRIGTLSNEIDFLPTWMSISIV